MRSYTSLDRAIAATIDKFHNENDVFLLANSTACDRQICINAAKLWQLKTRMKLQNKDF